MTFESAQLIDNIKLTPDEISKNPEKLKRLRSKNGLSMRQLAEATGHSRPHLREQLRKFGITSAKDAPRLGPYGWDWKNNQLEKNAKEQTVLSEVFRLNRDGKGCKLIAADLNRRGIPSKCGGPWHSSSVQNILNRTRNPHGVNSSC